MPYIVQSARTRLDPDVDGLIKSLNEGAWGEGEVNYVVFRIMLAWFKHNSKYATICKIMGTLHCVAQEFYSQVARSYEDGAIRRNGNIT